MDIILGIFNSLAYVIGGTILVLMAIGMVFLVITAIEGSIKKTINQAKLNAINKVSKIFMEATQAALKKAEEDLDKAIEEKVNEAIQRKLSLNPNF